MIYLILLFILFVLQAWGNQAKRSNQVYWGLCVLLSLFIGLRYRVGGDSLWYNNMFDDGFYPSLSELINGYDFIDAYFYPGWLFLNAAVKSFLGEFWGVQLLQATFVNITCFYVFDKYCKEQRYTCLLIYYFFYFLYFNTEIMRESVSASFFFLSYKYINERKWGKYYIFCLCAFLFHPSAIVTFIIPLLLVYSNLLKRHFYFYYIILFLLAFLLTYTVQTLISIMPTEFIAYKADYYMSREKNFNGVVGTLVMKVLPVLGLLPIIKKNFRRTAEEDTLFKLFLIYLIVYTFSIFTDGFYRLLNYFMPVIVIQMSRALYAIKKQKIMTKSRLLGIMALCAMTLVQVRYYFFTDLNNIGSADFKYYKLWYPYHSIFDGQKNSERETMYFRSMGHD